MIVQIVQDAPSRRNVLDIHLNQGSTYWENDDFHELLAKKLNSLLKSTVREVAQRHTDQQLLAGTKMISN